MFIQSANNVGISKRSGLTKSASGLSKRNKIGLDLSYFFFKDEKFEEGDGPSIYELVTAEDVDILQYIGWEEKPGIVRKRALVSKTLIF